MSLIDFYDLSPQVCPSCHGDLGPHGCACGRPWSRGEPDHELDERGHPQPGVRAPLTCPWCLEDIGSRWCCRGNHPDAHKARAELAAAPLIHMRAGGAPC